MLAVTGIALSAVLFLYLRDGVRADARQALERRAGEYHRELREWLDGQTVMLHALHGLFTVSDGLTRDAFAAALEPMRPYFPSMLAAGWLRRVPAAAGDAHRVEYLEPSAGRAALLGADAAGLPGWRDALDRACATGRAAATGRVRLGSAAEEGVVFAVPVFPAGAGAACPRLVGHVIVALAVNRVLDHSFAGLQAVRGDLYLIDADAPPGERLLGAYRRIPEAGPPATPPREEALESAPDAVVHTLEVGGRTWRMVLVPPPPALFMPGDAAAWIALVMGFLITVLVTGYLHREERAKAMLQTEARARAAMARMLRESEERFRLALRHSRVAVFSQDRELRFIWMYNPQVPIPAERFIGRTHAEIYAPEDAVALDALKRRVLETGRGTRQEVRLTVGGRVVVDDLVVEPLRDDGGDIVGVICAAIDITESTQIKEALAEAHAEAERANQAKTRFLAAASHDLRQPFQAMSLFHHILVSRLQEPKQVEIARKLGEALTAGNALLNALLDASALEAGNVKPRVVEFPFQEVAERLATEIADQAAGRGLEFRMVATSALVRSDPVLLERILRNLLVNALRYTQAGRILLGCRRRGGRLSVEVWDTGPGIAEDQLARIFEEFYRCGTEQQDGARGLGLGLSTVRRMAQMLDHPVTVRSHVGRGTVFAVAIPIIGNARDGDGCLSAASA